LFRLQITLLSFTKKNADISPEKEVFRFNISYFLGKCRIAIRVFVGQLFNIRKIIFQVYTGFDGADVIDLENVDSGTASISYQGKAGGTGGTLTISDGLHVAELSLVGDYSTDNFSLVPDQLKGTSITYLVHDLVV